jgi:acetyltransferase
MLENFRNMPAANIEAIVQVLRSISEMVCELPEISELDINPLIADENGVMALDARIVVKHRPPSLDRYAHMAIHPYPTNLVALWQLADGTNIKIRPIRPEDASIEQSFVHELSEKSKYFRFMQSLNELTQQMLVRFTQLDYSRELALIAVLEEHEKETELGVARYMMNPDGESCEFALVVADKWQNKGIGSHLMSSLIAAARERGIETMEGEILTNNDGMLKLTAKLGFSINVSPDDPAIQVVRKQL